MGEASLDVHPASQPWAGAGGKPSWPWNRLGHGVGGRKMLSLNEEEEATLTFREQGDGRKVSRLPSGKVVLVHLDYLSQVKGGERWKSPAATPRRLRHRLPSRTGRQLGAPGRINGRRPPGLGRRGRGPPRSQAPDRNPADGNRHAGRQAGAGPRNAAYAAYRSGGRRPGG